MAGAPSHSRLSSNATIAGDASLTVESIQFHLARLFDAHACSICHSTLTAPVKLPCLHIFCSECIRRQLTIESACPHPHCDTEATSIHVTALPELDAALAPIREAAAAASALEGSGTGSSVASTSMRTNYKHLVFLSAKACGAKTLLTEKLRQLKLPIQGNVQALADRYNEFVLKWNANVDSANPLTKAAIVSIVIKEDELRRARKVKGVNNSSSHFFKKLCSQKVLEPESDDHESDIVEEGDDFETLIRKTKARQAKLKRLREADLQTKVNVKKSRYSSTDTVDIRAENLTATSENHREVVVGICPLDIIGKPGEICENGRLQPKDDGWDHTPAPSMVPLGLGTSLSASRHRITLPERVTPSTHSVNSLRHAQSPGGYAKSKQQQHRPGKPSTYNFSASKFVIAGQKKQIDRDSAYEFDSEPLHSISQPGHEPCSHQFQRTVQEEYVLQPGTSARINCTFSRAYPNAQREAIPDHPLTLAGHNTSNAQQLSDETRQRIERNRLIALERKKKFYERQRVQQPGNRS